MVSDSFRLVADGFGWLRVVSDGCGSFADLVVTCLDLKVNIYIEIPQQLLHFFDLFPISTKNYGKTRLFSTWTKTNVKRTKSLTVSSFWLSTPYFPDSVCLSLLLIPRWSFHDFVYFAGVLREKSVGDWSTLNQRSGTYNSIFLS